MSAVLPFHPEVVQYFNDIAGSWVKGAQLYEIWNKINYKGKPTKMEGQLRDLLNVVDTVEFSDNAKEENIIRRWVLHDGEFQFKTL